MANKIEFIYEAVDNVSKGSNTAIASLGRLAKGVGIAAAAYLAGKAALEAFVAGSSKFPDEIGKMSTKLGISTEALSKFAYTSELTGVSLNTLENSFGRMTRGVSEAARGSGQAVFALRELGISAIELSQLSPDQQFNKLSQALSKVNNQGEKMRLFFDIFGKEGSELIKFLGTGTKGLNDMGKEAEKFGVVISTKMAAKAENFNDSITRVGQAFKGVGIAIANELSPALTDANNKFADWIASIRPTLADFTYSAVKAWFTIGELGGQMWDFLKDAAKGALTVEGWKRFGEGAVTVLTSLAKLFATFWSGWFDLAVIAWRGAWDVFKELARYAVTSITNFLYLTFQVSIKSIGYAFQVMWLSIVETGKWAWDKIKGVFTGDSGASLSDRINAQMDKVNEAFGISLALLYAETKKAQPNFEEVWKKIADISSLSIEGFVERGKEMLSGLGKRASDVGDAVASTTGISISKAAEAAEKHMALLKKSAETTSNIVKNNIAASAEDLNNVWLRLKLGWEQFLIQQGVGMEFIVKNMTTIFSTFSDGVGQAVGRAIAYGENLGQALKNVLQSVLANVIAMFVKMWIQEKILEVLKIASVSTTNSVKMGAISQETYGAAFASTAAIPIYGPFMAPFVAAASTALMIAGSLGARATGLAAGAAHGGMSNVPKEATYLLDKGERVLSPNQNADLKSFMSEGGPSSGGGGNTIIVHILENATSANSLLGMSKEEMDRVVGGPIISALNRLDRNGVRPEFGERRRRM